MDPGLGTSAPAPALIPAPRTGLPGEHTARRTIWRWLRRNRRRYNKTKRMRWRLIGRDPIRLVLEHPKCGRTWLRYMINQAEAKAYGVPLANTALNIWYRKYELPRFIYDHGFVVGRPLEAHAWDFPHAPPHWKGCVFLVRHPLRVMISWYHQCRYREGLFAGSFAQFLRDPWLGAGFYARYVDFYWQRLQGFPHLLLPFHELKHHTAQSLTRVLDFASLSLPAGEVEAIASNSTFERMQALQAQPDAPDYLRGDPDDRRSWKVRSGGDDLAGDFFSASDRDYLVDTCKEVELFRELGYLDDM